MIYLAGGLGQAGTSANGVFSLDPGTGALKLLGSVPLHKLHGSLNWALLPQEVAIYTDVRAAFRVTRFHCIATLRLARRISRQCFAVVGE